MKRRQPCVAGALCGTGSVCRSLLPNLPFVQESQGRIAEERFREGC